MADVKIVLQVDSTGAVKNIQDFDKAVESLGKTAATTKQKTETFGSEFTRNLIPAFTAATVAANLVEKGLHAVWDSIESGIKGAIEEEQSQHRLNTALQMTGRTRMMSTSTMLEWSKAQMAVTTYTHEEIEGVMTLLAQLTKLDGEGIRKATQGAMGLASVLGMDLQSAALMVTKAMEGNTQALARVGIRVDENIPKEEQAAAILEKLVALYPRATAELETMAGQLKNTKNLWGEFKENIGKAFLEATRADDLLRLLTTGLKAANKESEATGGTWKDMNVQYSAARGLIPPVVVEQMRETEATKDAIAPSLELLNIHRSSGAALDPLPEKILAVTYALKEMSLEQNASRSGWLAILGGIGWQMGETGMGKNMSVHQNVWKAQLDWLLGATKDTAKGMNDEWTFALQAMTAGLVSFGDTNATIWENVGKIFGNFIKDAMTGIESMVLKELWAAKMGTAADKAKAQTGAIKWIMETFPWPFSLAIAAGSFALINALFSKILKFEKGGYFPSATMLPAHVVGEAGPEFYLPEKKLRDVLRSEGGGGMRVYISASVFDDRTLDHIGPKLAQVMRNQARLGRN